MKPTIDAILSAFEALRDGAVGPDDLAPLQKTLLRIFDASGDSGMTATELVEATLGRKLTAAEDDLVWLRVRASRRPRLRGAADEQS